MTQLLRVMIVDDVGDHVRQVPLSGYPSTHEGVVYS